LETIETKVETGERGTVMEHRCESPTTGDKRFEVEKEEIRKRLLEYTRKAFLKLPQLEKPRILDIGCGSAIPTLELARLTQGEVIGIDVDQRALDRFAASTKEARLSDRVQAVNCSMFDMVFANESYDISWSEGSTHAIGFEKGLQAWKQFLKPGGFMVVHDEQGNAKEKIEQIHNCGYELMGYFILSEETWWTEYFAPLEKLIGESQARYTDDPKVLEELRLAQTELDMFRNSPEHNSSVYFVMKKKN